MSIDINTVLIGGTVKWIDQLKTFESGAVRCVILLTSERQGVSEGVTKTYSDLLPITLWGDRAKLAVRNVAKGDTIFLPHCRLSSNELVRDGKKRLEVNIVCVGRILNMKSKKAYLKLIGEKNSKIEQLEQQRNAD